MVAWGRENELAVAVDNGFAGGGLYRGPMKLAAGNSVAFRSSFADPAPQEKARRARPGWTPTAIAADGRSRRSAPLSGRWRSGLRIFLSLYLFLRDAIFFL